MKPFLPSSRAWRFAACLLVLSFAGGATQAQTTTEAKIHLMAETLRARDAGELDAAKENAAKLLALAPNDSSVQRLVRQIDAMIAARAAAPQPAPDEVVRIPAPAATVAAAAEPAPAVSVPVAKPPAAKPAAPKPDDDLEAEAAAAAAAETQRIEGLLAAVPKRRTEARRLAGAGRYDEAVGLLEDTIAALPLNPLTQPKIATLRSDRDRYAAERSDAADKVAAQQAADERARQARADAERAEAERAEAARTQVPPPAPVSTPVVAPAAAADSSYAAVRRETEALAGKGRAQYLAGDLDGAQETFRLVETRDPDNAEAKGFLLRIANDKRTVGALNHEKTRAQLLEEVTKSWQRPGIYQEQARETDTAAIVAPLMRKLESIVLPNVHYTHAKLGTVLESLGALSEENDPATSGMKGVNLVLLDPSKQEPEVTVTLRNVSLKRVLDFVTESIGYQYDVQPDAVVLRPGGEVAALDTAFFPVTRATVLRMTGVGAPTAAKSGDSSAGTEANGGEAAGMRAFLQQAGVNFDDEKGSSLAYDGSAMIVTQTARNLERIRNILNRYNDVRQVEIEAKFMEVQEGALDELGVQWGLKDTGSKSSVTYQTSGRTLADAFSSNATGQNGSISRAGTSSTVGTTTTTTDASEIPIINNPPNLPGTSDLAAAANPLALVTGVLGQFDVDAVIRALSQKQGTDLLSAPKVTVLSGNPANITVAQEMRYPQSYGQTQAQVGTGSASGGGSAGVAITAGTPQEFTMRNVGVELKVTPTVEEDDYSISLDLNPRVTEFDGFVEYGGPSIAISGGTTVNVPSGFYQPIFSVRDISTKVTIWDGATLVMGGLTREEVKKVSDKVPILGDLPLIGRAFRSKGESTQKRNLLIFVTANLVSPGGSLKKQNLKSVPANTLFQNPTIVTPASAEPRSRSEATH